MKRIFIDTNIIIDLLANRLPFSAHAVAIFQMADEGKVVLYTSSHSIITTHYLMKKFLPENELRELLHDLLEYFTVIAADSGLLKMALQSRHKDSEDAVQMKCAASVENMACIITRNIKDFKASEINVAAPDAFVLGMA